VGHADDIDPDTLARLRRFGLKASADEQPRRKPSPDKIAETLFGVQIVQFRLPLFAHHFRFEQSLFPGDKRRLWIADYANTEFKVMVEIDGGIWIQGAHAHPVDITRNMMKQNDAALLGYQTLRFATNWVKSKHAIEFLQRFLYARGWRQNA
jgi:very-short-patch-repair endonuclease